MQRDASSTVKRGNARVRTFRLSCMPLLRNRSGCRSHVWLLSSVKGCLYSHLHCKLQIRRRSRNGHNMVLRLACKKQDCKEPYSTVASQLRYGRSKPKETSIALCLPNICKGQRQHRRDAMQAAKRIMVSRTDTNVPG